MKRIINGKTFNTETSILVAEWDNSDQRTPNDFCYEEITIYKSKAGACFSVHYEPLRGKYMRLLCDDEILQISEKIEKSQFIIDHFPNLVQEG